MLGNVGLQQIIYSIVNDPSLRLPLFGGKITTLQLGGKDLLCRYLGLMKGHTAIRPDRVLAQSRASATGAIKNDEHLAALGCDLHALRKSRNKMTHPLRSTGITPLQRYKETDSPPQLDSDDAAMTYERFIRCGSAKPVANYYEAVRPSPAHRYFRPRGWSRLCLCPWHRRPGSHVPYKSPIELRAASMPDAAWAVSVHPPR